MRPLPRIVITMGDPAGIGPEVIVKALSDRKFRRIANFLVVGNFKVIHKARNMVGGMLFLEPADDFDDVRFIPDALNILEAVEFNINDLTPGKVNPDCGRAAVQAIEVATKMVLKGKADALVTAPISKEAVHQAGLPFPGHTEFLATLCGVSETRLILVCDELRVVHATGHMALKEAIKALTSEGIVRTVELALPVMRQLGFESPRIAVAALNPHAEEGGALGDEDDRLVLPAVQALQKQGYNIIGPVPADTLFYRAVKGEFDLVVALYHDQGHIPVKVLAFERAVNVTAGLPIIRTSPDHGVAFDIAWQNKAQETSMKAAIELAVKMTYRRK